MRTFPLPAAAFCEQKWKGMGSMVDDRKLAEERIAMLDENAEEGEQCDEDEEGGELGENPNFPSQWETQAREWLATFLSENRPLTMAEVEAWISSNHSILPDDLRSLTKTELLGRFSAIQTSFLRQHQKHTSENSAVGRPPSYSRLEAVVGEGEAIGPMSESATDALDDEEEDTGEDPFPHADPYPSSDNSVSTDASFAHGNGGESSNKRRRDDEYEDLISLVAKGFGVLNEICAEIKKMCRAETEIIEARSRLPSELVAMGLDTHEVVKAAIKLGDCPGIFGVWNCLDDELKKKFILHLLKK